MKHALNRRSFLGATGALLASNSQPKVFQFLGGTEASTPEPARLENFDFADIKRRVLAYTFKCIGPQHCQDRELSQCDYCGWKSSPDKTQDCKAGGISKLSEHS